MRVVVGFETSGVLSSAIRAYGHHVETFDILPGDLYQFHNICSFENFNFQGFDAAILHPPCTYLASSGLHWNNKIPGRLDKTQAALKLFQQCLDVDCPIVVIENPVGAASRLRKSDQIIQPWQFGDNASKSTCLWLKGVPKLLSTECLLPEFHCPKGLPRWANQTASGQNKLAPSESRWQLRSKTFPGIAKAITEQWFNPSEILEAA